MESSLGEKAHSIYGPLMTDMKAAGKSTMEWDLNDWRWDGHLFAASRLNHLPPDCRSRPLFPVQPEVPSNTNFSNGSSDCSGDINQINGSVQIDGSANRESEKRGRVIVVPEDGLADEAGSLNLKLGGQVYPIAEDEVEKWEGKCGKRTKIAGTSSSHPVCQVEGCQNDLSNAKDYHRRHKVCEVHSKATSAVVGNVLQRFCQQCSRFHAIKEFDEGKRSCRRRLAGHNRRRRKQPEPPVNLGSQNDEQSSSYLLICLLRILTNLHSNSSDQSKDQNLLSHLLRNLANLAGTHDGSNISRLLQGSPDLPNIVASAGTSEKDTPTPLQQSENAVAVLTSGLMTNADQQQKQQVHSAGQSSAYFAGNLRQPTENAVRAAEKQHKLNNIDLNNVYDESQDDVGNIEEPHSSLNTIPSPQQDSLKSSPPHASGNSGSSAHSLSSSSGSQSQVRTDRIIFKLFGKDPNDLPHLLRTQILDWLSHKPTDIEGYIKPGCIILTLYLRLDNSSWEELCGDLNSSLSKLMRSSDNSFWRSGWIYTMVQQRAAFICDGQVVLDTPLPSKGYNNCSILSVSPIAVPVCETVQFTVKSFNLSRSTSRLQCALEGRYLVQESCSNLMEDDDTSEHEDIVQLHFSCSIPKVAGRGFIEVEDYGLNGSFFPFIVSEPNVCSEICTLESIMEVAQATDDIKGGDEKLVARNKALDFIHEIGWLLHRSCLKYRARHVETSVDLFPFERLKWLLDYSVDHDWCAVVKKLLDIVFDGCVDAGSYPSVREAICETGLLHTAVRRNNRPMVESLLRYLPRKVAYESDSNHKQLEYGQPSGFIFRPDVAIGGLTPLHIAASGDGFESVLDALLEDPGGVGLESWRNVRCGTGLTPNDYASLRGKYSYIDLVNKKVRKKASTTHVVVDIPDIRTSTKQTDGHKSAKISSFQTEMTNSARPPCGVCDRKLGNYGYIGTAVTYKPAMLSLLAIAAVCVCVALLFKSEPEVYMFKPFRWNELKFGVM